jgi:hypothetical protein
MEMEIDHEAGVSFGSMIPVPSLAGAAGPESSLGSGSVTGGADAVGCGVAVAGGGVLGGNEIWSGAGVGAAGVAVGGVTMAIAVVGAGSAANDSTLVTSANRETNRFEAAATVAVDSGVGVGVNIPVKRSPRLIGAAGDAAASSVAAGVVGVAEMGGVAVGTSVGDAGTAKVALGAGAGGVTGDACGEAAPVGETTIAIAVGPVSLPPADRPIRNPSPALTTRARPTTITIVRCISGQPLPGHPAHDATELSA